MYTFLIFFRSNLLRETRNQLSPLIGRNDIPHFVLSKTIVALLGQLVTRMNLNGEVELGVNELDQ